ncbi:MAG: translation initiation factor IF-2 [Deltaproteobacteria bacterium]|nr:translation initiation factor IF-2 [Deltaproteobacteria bacterium]
MVEKRVAATVIRRRARVVTEPPPAPEPPAAVAAEAQGATATAGTEMSPPTTATSAAAAVAPPAGAVQSTAVTTPATTAAKSLLSKIPLTGPGAQRPGMVARPGTPGAPRPETKAEIEARLRKPLRRKKSRAEWETEDIRKAGGLFRFVDEVSVNAEAGGEAAVEAPLEEGAEVPVVAAEAETVTAAPTAEPVVPATPVAVPVKVPLVLPVTTPLPPVMAPRYSQPHPMERVFRPTGLKRKKTLRKDFKKTQITQIKSEKKVIKIEEAISVSALSQAMGVKASELLRQLMQLGTMVTINQNIDPDTATLLAQEHGYEVERTAINEAALLKGKVVAPVASVGTILPIRAPIVTVMGHVDHGKTSLLDAIRATDVAGGEAGGITQHIGASQVQTSKGLITFLDTPGHEAFTALRARGAQVTDLVVLVVAADDGVMPQTIEAINHAKAAGVPIIVAVNKMDKADANPDRVKRELSEHGVVAEDWGGDAILVPTSAKSRQGIDQLLEMILLQAEVLQLRADPAGMAEGRVIEARLDRGRGPVATILVQSGTLRRAATVVCGTASGRVRALVNPRGEPIDSVGPGCAAEVLGLDAVPVAGDPLVEAADERAAKVVIETRTRKQRESQLAKSGRASLEDLFKQTAADQAKVLRVIVKGDVQGSVEAVVAALERSGTEKVTVEVLHRAVGGITEGDVLLASASRALVIGFNVVPDGKARRLAQSEQIEIKQYSIIYELIDDVRKAMAGLLEPTRTEKILGRADVRQIFQVSKIGTIAGCQVADGLINRSAKARLLRDSVVIFTGRLASLKRFKDDAREVTNGQECGIGLEGFQDLKPGDVIESFQVEETAAVL